MTEGAGRGHERWGGKGSRHERGERVGLPQSMVGGERKGMRRGMGQLEYVVPGTASIIKNAEGLIAL